MKLTGSKLIDLYTVVKTSSNHLKSNIKNFIIGFYRSTPINGYEYELYFKNRLNCCSIIRLNRPLQTLRITEIREITNKKTIHFILPLTQSKLGKFKQFLTIFEIVSLKQDQGHVTLTIVYSSKNSNEINQIIEQFKKRTKFKEINLILEMKSTFSRGESLQIAADTLADEQLLFFCDVDIFYTQQFLDLCRSNSELNKKVFFPILFSFYNPKLLPNERLDEFNLVINKETGYWRDSGFGMVCLFKKDFRIINGFESYINRTHWGGEDLFLYRKFLNLDHLNVIRSITPSLFHMYHSKQCDYSLMTLNEYKDCIHAKISNEASQNNFGLFYFNLTNKFN